MIDVILEISHMMLFATDSIVPRIIDLRANSFGHLVQSQNNEPEIDQHCIPGDLWVLVLNKLFN